MSLWSVLESIPTVAAVHAQWRHWLGDELGLLQPYLRPWPELARSYPRLDGKSRGLFFRVVGHGPDDWVGICDETEERLVLSRGDLIVYELDVGRLLDDVAQALGWERASGRMQERSVAVHRVGTFTACAGYSFPAYFSRVLSFRGMTQAICAIASTAEEPFLLLAPTGKWLSDEGRRILSCRQSSLLALAEVISASGPGKWQATEVARHALEGFAQRHLPREAEDDRTFFPTPAGARWGDLRIRFLDGHTVSAAVGDLSRVLHYSQMGMADGRHSRATQQWELLRVFASHGGTLTWDSRAADRKNQKRRERLARDLKAFFRIEGEPIVLTEDGKGWRVTFAIEEGQ